MSIANQVMNDFSSAGGAVGKLTGQVVGKVSSVVLGLVGAKKGIMPAAWNEQATAADQHREQEMQAKMMTEASVDQTMNEDWENDDNGE